MFAEKTQQPTPYRRQTARREGQFARSPEVVGAFVIGGMAMAMPILVKAVWNAGTELMHVSLSETVHGSANVDSIIGLRPEWIRLAAILATIGIAIFLLAVLANLLQRSAGWKPERVQPSLDHLNPASRIRSWFSLVRILLGVASFLRFFLTLALLVSWLWIRRASLGNLMLLDTEELVSALVTLGCEGILAAAVCVGIWSAFDYVIQWWRLEQSLRMTPDEIRDETRKREIDPQIKMQRRARHLGMIQNAEDCETGDLEILRRTT